MGKTINYTIIHVNDRAKDLMDRNKKILNNLNYISGIRFFNGNDGNAKDVLNHRKIKIDVWNPYDGRLFPPLPGEYGIWLSNINTWDYIIDNDLENLLVLEDDISLVESAEENLNLFISELPDDWDFLSLYHFSDQNQYNSSTDIGAKHIHKSINQPAAGQAMLYSNSGARKLRKLVQRKGIEYTSDCFIFEQSRIGAIKGYSIIPNKKSFLKHEYKTIDSLIDPENKRSVDM